jgi:hypothetical protein
MACPFVSGRSCTYLAREEIEIRRVELVALCKVGDAQAEMAQLVHRSRPLLESLERIGLSVLLRGLN